MPPAARETVALGVRRLAAYQDEAYARLYLERLATIRKADERAKADGRLLREVARHLALRMSYEDVIRVAEVKIDPARLARIAVEIGAKPDEPFTVTEFLKPGIEEMCSILPPWLAKPILATAERRGLLDRWHWGMEVNTASVTGFLRFWLLAKLRRWRPKSYRFAQEQQAIETWLGLIQAVGATVRRPGAGGDRMRAPDQGLRRHPQARLCQLQADRDASDPADPGRAASPSGSGRTQLRAPGSPPSPTPTATPWRGASPA